MIIIGIMHMIDGSILDRFLALELPASPKKLIYGSCLIKFVLSGDICM